MDTNLSPFRHMTYTFSEVPYGSRHYRQALRLRQEVLRDPLGLPMSEADLAGEELQHHYGLLAGDELAACVVIKPLSKTHCKLRQMAVSPSHQASGLGRRLIEAVEENLRQRGFESIEMAARETAVGFYERLGFQRVGEPFIEVTIPHFKMEKSLCEPLPSEPAS